MSDPRGKRGSQAARGIIVTIWTAKKRGSHPLFLFGRLSDTRTDRAPEHFAACDAELLAGGGESGGQIIGELDGDRRRVRLVPFCIGPFPGLGERHIITSEKQYNTENRVNQVNKWLTLYRVTCIIW